MAAEPKVFLDRVRAFADDEGRLPLSRMTGWEIFPFDADGLQTVPFEAPVLPEPARFGAGGGEACGGCRADEPAVWEDEHWRLVTLKDAGVPLLLMLQPKAHHDLTDLPNDLAAEMGLLIVRISTAIEGLPNIGRAHVSKWGDGGEHLHLFFYARPAGFLQLRGSCMSVWDDLLPPPPAEERDADARAVANALTAAGPLPGR